MINIMTMSWCIVRTPLFWFLAWGVLVGTYIISLQYGLFVPAWDSIIYLLQMIADICIGLFGYLAFKTKSEKVAKIFYLLIFLSLIPGLFANEIYNVLINIIKLDRYGESSLYWTIGYTLFLLIQSYAWFYLFNNKIRNKEERQKWLTVHPYLGSGIIIFLWLIIILVITSNTIKQMNIVGLLNSLLEIISFTFISMNLSRTQNNALIYVEIGFLLLIGFNFAHRFSSVLSVYYKLFDAVWLSCLIVIINGLYASFKMREQLQFFEENSIHVLTSGAFILFANFILIVFTISAFGLGMLQIDKIPNFKVLMLDVPSAFVFAYSLTLLLAKFLAWRLSFPLEGIVKRIGKIANEKSLVSQNSINQFRISEVETLEKFITVTISELRYANDVKSQFLMNMSHDFRTPASGILYMSRLIHDQIADEEIKRLQKMVVNSSEQLIAFFDDILDYSKLEYDKLKLDKQLFDVMALINELVAFMAVKAHERSLNITVKCYQDKIAYFSDRVIVQRILLNLLSNAVKFTNFGEILITAFMEIIESRKWLIIKVKDPGIGIEKAHQKRIFEPFYRVESAESSKYPGIGLGLSNVNLMLKKLDGRITLKSELGSGSEFTIYLPV